jgi:hypothetical protein
VVTLSGHAKSVASCAFSPDGLRIATTAEVTRAREGSTPGFEVKLDPPLQMRRTAPSGTFPDKINEFGIESGSIGTSWYVVRPPTP